MLLIIIIVFSILYNHIYLIIFKFIQLLLYGGVYDFLGLLLIVLQIQVLLSCYKISPISVVMTSNSMHLPARINKYI